jgi:hypothetical protein
MQGGVLALVVWDGTSRGVGDATVAFADEARRRGWPVAEISTLSDQRKLGPTLERTGCATLSFLPANYPSHSCSATVRRLAPRNRWTHERTDSGTMNGSTLQNSGVNRSHARRKAPLRRVEDDHFDVPPEKSMPGSHVKNGSRALIQRRKAPASVWKTCAEWPCHSVRTPTPGLGRLWDCANYSVYAAAADETFGLSQLSRKPSPDSLQSNPSLGRFSGASVGCRVVGVGSWFAARFTEFLLNLLRPGKRALAALPRLSDQAQVVSGRLRLPDFPH